jgi:epoxide hydrolase-like predicted phosphatase
LTTSVWPAFEAFCRNEGLASTAVRDLFKHDSGALQDLRELETGECEPAEFERRFSDRLGIAGRADGLIDRMFAALEPEERMLAAVRGARAHRIVTGVISNSWGSAIYDGATLEELFDDVVISGEVGLHKPQPEIYLLACERLGVEPADAVFVDDLRENCAGAESVGMTAVLHRDPAETVSRVGDALGVDLESEAGEGPVSPDREPAR